MGRAVAAVDPSNLHLTLEFLGDIRVSDADSIAAAMAHIVDDIEPFQIELQGLGMFPHEQRPRILWTAITPDEPLQTIATHLANSLAEYTPDNSDRPWQAHVTLARIKARPPADWGDLIADHASQSFGRASVDTLRLIASQLTPQGPRYTHLRSVNLD